MNTRQTVLQRWCGKPWLMTLYVIGVLVLILAVFRWGQWETPRRILGLLAVLLPLHVFEENTFPDGFHYILNLVQRSERPNAGPMNRLSDMISNFGAEVLFLVLLPWGGNAGTCIFAVFFGIGEAAAHTVFGVLVRRKLRAGGMKTIYGPGLATAYLTLLPLSVYALYYLSGQAIRLPDVLLGLGLSAAIVVLLIRLPMMLFGKFQPEYEFSSSGYFRRYE